VTYQKTITEPLGSSTSPLSDEGLFEKFHRLTSPVLGTTRARRAAELLQGIEAISDLALLMESLSPAPASAGVPVSSESALA
jgi:hypothetical protein